MSSRSRLLLSAIVLGSAPLAAQAQTFFHAVGADRIGMAVEVQLGVVGAVVVSQAQGGPVSTATFSGDVVEERSGGEIPFTTTIMETADVTLATLPGNVAEAAVYRRIVGIGIDVTEFQRQGRTVVLEPLGFHAASALEHWGGRYTFVRTNAEGLVDATELNFATLVEFDGSPALMGVAPDGRTGLLLVDLASGVVAGAYETAPGEPVSFALLGKSFDAARAAGVWVATGADGFPSGRDHGLQVQRLTAVPVSGKLGRTPVGLELGTLAQRALEIATARASAEAAAGTSG